MVVKYYMEFMAKVPDMGVQMHGLKTTGNHGESADSWGRNANDRNQKSVFACEKMSVGNRHDRPCSHLFGHAI